MKTCTFVLVLGALCAAENVLQTNPGRTETLRCGITDTSSILKWQRGNDLLHSTNPRTGIPLRGKVELVQRSRLKIDRDLEISRIAPQDAGLFTCLVNSHQELHRLVVASVSVSPSGRLEVGTQVILQCDVAGLPQGAEVVWVRPDGGRARNTRLHLVSVTLADAGPWECVFSAGGKTMKETVTLQVAEPRSETTAAPSTTSMTEGTMTPCPDCDVSPIDGPPELLGLSWWVWAAVGAGGLVVLLWVLILILYSHMKRRKRRFVKMRKAAQLRPNQYCQCPGGPTARAGRRGKKPSAPPFHTMV